MMMRRRPIARAAVVGGVAYHAGKKTQQGRDQDAETEARLEELEAQQAAQAAPVAAAPAAPAAPAVGSNDMVQQLENLKRLLDDGVLTQAEFDMQKQKLLAGV